MGSGLTNGKLALARLTRAFALSLRVQTHARTPSCPKPKRSLSRVLSPALRLNPQSTQRAPRPSSGACNVFRSLE